MIERILDKYFAMKLVKKIQHLSLEYILDFIYEINIDSIVVKVKKPKYKDDEYRTLFKINSTAYMEFLTNSSYLRETFQNDISEYLRFER